MTGRHFLPLLLMLTLWPVFQAGAEEAAKPVGKPWYTYRFNCRAAWQEMESSVNLLDGDGEGKARSIIDTCGWLWSEEEGNKGKFPTLFVLPDSAPKDEWQKAREIKTFAQSLKKAADAGDIEALVALNTINPDTSREDYLKHLYNDKGIQQADPADFPGTVFDSAQFQRPAEGADTIGWLDNDTFIYKAYRHPAEFGGKLLGNDTIFFSFNTKTQLKSENLDEADLNKTAPPLLKKVQKKSAERVIFCVELLDADGQVCHKELSPEDQASINAKNRRHQDYFDSKTIVFKKGDTEKFISFDRVIYPLDVHYDPFSQLYWLTSQDKVWRFDRAFNQVAEETYPRGIWNCWTASSPGVFSWRQPCNPLKYSVKSGFLISARLSVKDLENSNGRQLDASSLFLATKDGKAFKILDNASLKSLAISPDGCKAIFSNRTEQPGTFTDKLTMIDVCKYFERK